jgi:hypothetical protein
VNTFLYELTRAASNGDLTQTAVGIIGISTAADNCLDAAFGESNEWLIRSDIFTRLIVMEIRSCTSRWRRYLAAIICLYYVILLYLDDVRYRNSVAKRRSILFESIIYAGKAEANQQ